jgi:hypothetical protein
VNDVPPADEGGIRLVGEPVVDRAEAFSDEQSDTAELPLLALLPADLFGTGYDRLVAPPESGVVGWWARFAGALRGCGRFLVPVAALCAGPMFLFAGRVVDVAVAAPALSDLAGGFGLLLLAPMLLSYLALSALPMVLCLAGVVGVLVAWGPEGRLAGGRAVLGAVASRAGRLWFWLAALGVLGQVRPAGAAVSSVVLTALLSGVLTAFLGVLGCVVLFERGRGPRRAFGLLASGPGGTVAGLGVTAFALAVLPSAVDGLWGRVAGSAVTAAGALLWSVAALLTYAQARRAEGGLTSAQLRRELAA